MHRLGASSVTPLLTARSPSISENRVDRLQRVPLDNLTEKEVDMIIKAGATAVGLGPHRLQVETATIALLATVMLWSDSLQPLSS
ncbi:uncharacterized protein LOC130781431 [Actinidia eriantha]|uniref:uncharacterized protein LOC130781431 n=1 Tax=Actinidia eriantha TaxID=165200 RepID=UPI002583F0A0|nr:uncharacterized protein LOC130781431 [Actinidia eriantha]